jgi:hypothetical protein
LAPYGDGVTLEGTLAPPRPLQVEAKYKKIQESNPEGVTEVLVRYTYPDMWGFAEARAVFDADEHFPLVDGRVVSVLDLFRGMQVQLSRGRIGSILGNPERRYEIPVPPLPEQHGLHSSRVIGLVKHIADEIVKFRWANQMVQVTPGHVVWSADRRGWVGAHELAPGELIRVAGNSVAPVEGLRHVPGHIEVFGIEVEYFHNYFVGTGANAMLVHNGPEKVARPLEAAAANRLPNNMARVLSTEELAKVEGNIAKAVEKYGQLPEAHAVHQAVAAKAKELGFEGPIIVFENAPPNIGASMHPNGTLTIPANTWENGFSRFGTQISGEGAVAHEVAHLSRNLPEAYLHENLWKLHGTPDGWLGEAAVSRAAAESPLISTTTKQQLLQDAVQCERVADLFRQEQAMLQRMKNPLPGDDLNALNAAYQKWRSEILTPFLRTGK